MSNKSSLKPVELFHAGPPKSATTWVFHALKEHPQISTSERDTIHYFDMFHAKSEDWYNSHFTTRDPMQDDVIRFDPTYSYICSPRAPQRIAQYNPDAKVMVCVRNPVDRAFSHYWHIKKQVRDEAIQFEDVLKHYNNYATWLEHGFIGVGMKVLYDSLPKENIYVMEFDELKRAPEAVYDKVADFAGIDKSFRPSVLNKKVNTAGAKKNFVSLNINRIAKRIIGEQQLDEMSRHSAFMRFLSGKGEYARGMSDDIRAQLYEVCESEIVEIERLSGLDLSHWQGRPSKLQKKDKVA